MAATTASTADREMMTFLPLIGNSSIRENEQQQQQQGNYNNGDINGDSVDEPFDDNMFGDEDDEDGAFVDASVTNGSNISQQQQNIALTTAFIANSATPLYALNHPEAFVGMNLQSQKMFPMAASLSRHGEGYANGITFPNGGVPLSSLNPLYQAAVTSSPNTMVGPLHHQLINTAIPQQAQPMSCYPYPQSNSFIDQQQEQQREHQEQGSINPRNLRGTIFRQSCGSSQDNPTSTFLATSTTTNNKRKRQMSSQRKTYLKKQQGEEDNCKKKSRNLREQQRSHQINERIAELREVLKEIGVHFEKTDKNTVLRTVYEYIRNRQTLSAQLDSEHSKLLETINEVATQARSKEQKHIKSDSKNHPMRVIDNSITPLLPHTHLQPSKTNDALFHIPEFNYKTIFSKCPTALAVIGLDGRFLDCNSQFEQLTGFDRKELLAMQDRQDVAASSSSTSSLSSNSSSTNNNDISLFHILYSPTDVEEVCQSMSSLAQCENGDESSNDDAELKGEEKDSGRERRNFWRGVIRSKKKPNVKVKSN